MRRHWYFLLGFLTYISSLSAEFETLTLHIEKLKCPHCALLLTDSLKEVNGVAEIDVNVSKSTADLKLKRGVPMKWDLLSKATEKVGYTLTEADAVITGRLRREEKHSIIESFRDRTRLYFLDQATLKQGETRVGKALEKEIRASSRNGIVTVKGKIHGHGSAKPTFIMSAIVNTP